MSIVVRKGTMQDWSMIVNFQVKMSWETEKLKLQEEVVRLGVKAILDDPAKGCYWVAEVDGKVQACLLTLPEWSDWRNGTVLWIHSVYVEEGARRMGLFSKLYLHLKGMVERKEEGLRGLRLYVDKRNFPAQKVYQSLGMSCDHYDMYEWLA